MLFGSISGSVGIGTFIYQGIITVAAICLMQVAMGLPEPRAASSLPRLQLIIRGISRSQVGSPTSQKPRLPISINILRRIFTVLHKRPLSFDTVMIWATCTLCFFGFFRAGEITIYIRTLRSNLAKFSQTL